MKRGFLHCVVWPLCCALLLAGCQSAAPQPAQSAPDSASRPASSAPAQPEAYTGPLYEISVGKLSEKLPGFGSFDLLLGYSIPVEVMPEVTRSVEEIGIPMDTFYTEFGAELAECYQRKQKLRLPEAYYQTAEEKQAAREEDDELIERIAAFAADWRASHPGADTDGEDTEYAQGSARSGARGLIRLCMERHDVSRPAYIYLYAYSNSGDFIKYRPATPADPDDKREGKGSLTNSKLEHFPELERYLLFGTTGGRTVFYDTETGRFHFADGAGNILYTTPDNMVYVSCEFYDDEPSAFYLWRYAREGMFPFYNRDTGRCGYLNVEDFTTFELDEEYSLRSYTQNGETVWVSEELAFCEGLQSVIYAQSTDTLHTGGGGMRMPRAEADIAGYIDKTGAFVFKFCDLPGFENQVVIDATGYVDGAAIVQYRPRGQASVSRLGEGRYYKIDTEGNILAESNENEYDLYASLDDGIIGIEVYTDLATGEQRVDYENSVRMRVAGSLPIPAERILLKDDLVLYKNESTGGFELMDANGTVYPIEAPEEIFCAHVMGNGLVTLSVLEEGWEELRYYVLYDDIRPADLAVDTQGFEPQAVRVSDYYALPE